LEPRANGEAENLQVQLHACPGRCTDADHMPICLRVDICMIVCVRMFVC